MVRTIRGFGVEAPGPINRICRAVIQDQTPRGALSRRVAVVVGGASGIGRTVASALARQGARVVVADFDAERLERTVEEILRLGSADAALALPTDVRSDSSVRSLAADTIKAMGRADILINMAGVFLQGPLDHIKPGDWKWMLETNLLGTVRTTLAFLPHMVERGKGHIVNAISVGDTALTVAYDSGAAAVAAFTKGLAAEIQGKGVRVSLFAIGPDGPRIGINTRSRGMGRLLHRTDDLEEASTPNGKLVDELIEIIDR
jgi:NAD(P)-dependent dehydrogenase (short-subunit alcohol dehydrogenase family)